MGWSGPAVGFAGLGCPWAGSDMAMGLVGLYVCWIGYGELWACHVWSGLDWSWAAQIMGYTGHGLDWSCAVWGMVWAGLAMGRAGVSMGCAGLLWSWSGLG
jgi:hypothetical protein